MRFKKPIVALSTAALLALAACGGGGDEGGSDEGSGGSINKDTLGSRSDAKDAEAKGPVSLDGAEKGGTITVLTLPGLTTSIDPTEAYYSDVLSILEGLMTRSLTQYVYDPKSGGQVLVPDLATDLGTPNDDYTEWKFTLRDGVKWETGDPITAEEVAFGICRSMDSATFPEGAGPYYSVPFLDVTKGYKGPYSTKGASADKPATDCGAVTTSGNDITIKLAQPFPDYDYWAAFPAIGPIPLDPKVSDPAKYRLHPWSSGPYKIDQYTTGKTLTLVKNDQWDPATDPARTQYPDKYEFKAGVQSAQIDQILLADTGEGQTTMTYDDVQAKDFRKFQTDFADRLVVGGAPTTYYYAPDYRKISDKAVREALIWATPYKDTTIASGLIPDINAIPATQLQPPGIPGREEFNMLPDHPEWATDPDKAKQILEDSGNLGFEIKFLWRTDNDTDVKAKDVLVKALTEAGFKATPIATTEAKYTTERDDITNDLNFRSAGWGSDWPSGSSWIPPLLGTNPSKTSAGTNYEVFSEADVDAKIKDILAGDPAKAPAAWGALEKEILTKYLPIIPRFYSGAAMAHGSRIQGFENDSNGGVPTWKNLWVSSE